MARRYTTPLFYDNIAIGIANVETGRFTTQTTGYQIEAYAVAADEVFVVVKEQIQNFFAAIIECTQQDGCWQFPTTVDTDEELILGIKFKVQPRTTVRDNACGVEQLTG